jgi:hypothetical protein
MFKDLSARGDLGHVVKAQAGSELLPAVGAAIRGKQFVSAELAGQALTDPVNDEVRDRHRPGEVLPLLSEAAD